jgi:outer membrane protein
MVSQEAQARFRLEARTDHWNSEGVFAQMKRSLAIIVTLASGLVLSAAAQTSPAPAASVSPAKVAVIAFQAAVGQTNEFQRNFADLQKKYEPRRDKLKIMADEIESLDKQLQAQGDKLSDTERASRAKTIDDKKKQAQRFAEDAQNDLTSEMQEVYNGVASKVYDVLATYAQQQGFTLVVDGSSNQQQAPVVLYASPSTDITKAVIDAYNLKSGVPAPPPQPAAAAPKPTVKPPAAQ